MTTYLSNLQTLSPTILPDRSFLLYVQFRKDLKNTAQPPNSPNTNTMASVVCLQLFHGHPILEDPIATFFSVGPALKDGING